ncbi:MAG: hypothetical protein APF84_01100 [Gracilibacter sp. BRH_c7a]|nr:MAG: hypothetical protein APF84_01100 [Gracilibacter sp. BRH_c7a]
MDLINKFLGQEINITIYTSDTCTDCQAAKRFFSERGIDVNYKNIAEEKNREELKNKHGRMAVPTIIIGDKAILGFVDNKAQIIKLLRL